MDVAQVYPNLIARTGPADVDGCQPWLGYVDRRGYGRLGRRMAHRVAYLLRVGPIPEGMTVDHKCFRTDCVNPAHLRLLTHLENSRLQRSASKAACANGHPYTIENTYRRPNGSRDCRTCIRDRVAKYRSAA